MEYQTLLTTSAEKFDEATKLLFRDKQDVQFTPFGSPLDKDPTDRTRKLVILKQ